MAKTAILFSGSAYNFKFSIQSLMDNMVIPNDADVFILTTRANMRRKVLGSADGVAKVENYDDWNNRTRGMMRDTSMGLDAIQEQSIRDTFGDRLKMLVFLEDMPDYDTYLGEQRVLMVKTINKYRAESHDLGLPKPFANDIPDKNSNDGNIKCIVDQYNHIKKCYQMMRTFGDYDIVARVRLDFICPFPFIFEHYYLNNDYHYLYNCGSFRSDPFEWADEFCFFAHKDTAEKVFMNLDKMGFITERKYNTVYLQQNNDFIFAPETQFSILLYELDIKVSPIKIYRSSCYTNEGRYDYMNYIFRRDITLEHEYELVCEGPSDINEHLPTLRRYAEECDHITEMGTRYGNSDIAFMMARPKKFISYDLQHNAKIDYLKLIAEHNNINAHFLLDSVTQIEIEETDLLFIDTNHHAEQCEVELRMHASKARKYIIFHDTTTFWEHGQGNGKGLKHAIEPFLSSNPEWKIVERFTNNNGLLILGK